MSELPSLCQEIEEELSALIDEELTSGREAEVRAHLDGCDRCALRLRELCNVDLALADLGVPEVPPDLAQRLAERITDERAEAWDPAPRARTQTPRARTETPRAPRRGLWGRLAVAGVAAAAVLLAFVVSNRLEQEAEVLASTPEIETVVAEFESVDDQDLAVVFELDTMEDLAVIENLELLERLIAMEAVEG